ncbi:MAG TPA: LysR family transcriptional regulator [Xanthobacteraceae bacterium]|nr:LysR family transcriptional regulator [Xanthobacteraceae bacterium]
MSSNGMDWDKLKVFHVAAEAGSFTHAGEALGLSQSAVSRQVSALEQELKAPLFHRHARGLILTEQGEMLFRTAHDVFMKLEAVRTKLTDNREKPNGEMKVTTTVGLGSYWLTARIDEFLELYPDIRIHLQLTDEELDLGMREADVAIRLRQPVQPDLIQRKLFTVHFHAYASTDYLAKKGHPRSPEELDGHRLLMLGGSVPGYFSNLNWLAEIGRANGAPRTPSMTVNNVVGLKVAVENGVGIATLPDYLVEGNANLVRLFSENDPPVLDAYFVYPEELRSVARIQVFRDFLLANAQRWKF